MSRTSIEWTEETWNPTVGCTVVSPGCTNCYAMRMAARLDAMGIEKYKGLTRKSGGKFKWTGRVRLDITTLEIPYRWKKPKTVFVNSMSDLFHEGLSETDISQVWKVMADLPQHRFQVLTKRAERLAEVTSRLPLLSNVWLGVSIENRNQLSRLTHLKRATANVRFISFEPLLEDLGVPDLTGIDWAIVGGESGPGARRMDASWVEGLYLASRGAGAAFHFKQWGGVHKKRNGRNLHGRTYDEMPAVI